MICGFHEDLRGLTQVSLQVERGGVFVDSGIASTRLYYALNNQAHYAGDAGFLNFNDTSAAGVTTRRYRIQAQSLGQTITSNVITARPTAPGGQVQVNEPQGAHTWLTPPAVRAADRLAWGPSAERSIVTLYRLESSSTTGGWAVAVEGVFEVDQAQFSWGDPTTETWVQARTPLPPGRYALDVMNIDRDGWVTGWSTDRARGSDAFYRFDLY